MASLSLTGSALSAPLSLSRPIKATNGASSFNSVSFFNHKTQRTGFPSLSCAAAKPETVDKVCEIVKKQLALADDATVTGESKFSDLGADSLDTVEIVMGLEEHFQISVEETSAQNIETVHDAAEMIEGIIENANK
ncbi:hypothetical protein LUZ61_000033 [Rhynchospora tenuis]|uniref:Acyl carrier protein n=1 Tax=Rhynchospora tenuis TaxID=198213 RepID=A0AAD5ZEH8_9POAL|nr:hypothetical protein LUZ61_021038 [Rhynchospora tenuis]KAJ3696328.1 hypothetical protein LUZ61_000033 [Rhynchospora tenuis]